MIDFHTHLTESGVWHFKQVRADISTLCADLDSARAESAILLPIAGMDREAWALETAARSGGRLVTFLPVDPLIETPSQRLCRINALRAPGLKLHPRLQQLTLDDPRVLSFFRDLGQSYAGVLLVDCFLSDSDPERRIQEVEVFVEQVRGMRIVLAHCGGFRFQRIVPLVNEYQHVFVDTSMTLHVFRRHGKADLTRALASLLTELPSTRILFGSDFPECRVPDAVKLTEDVLAAGGFSDMSLRNVFHENAERLLQEGFDASARRPVAHR